MNTETGRIYPAPEDIAAAEARVEPLLFGTLADLQDEQAVIFNQAERRAQARIDARQRKKDR